MRSSGLSRCAGQFLSVDGDGTITIVPSRYILTLDAPSWRWRRSGLALADAPLDGGVRPPTFLTTWRARLAVAAAGGGFCPAAAFCPNATFVGWWDDGGAGCLSMISRRRAPSIACVTAVLHTYTHYTDYTHFAARTHAALAQQRRTPRRSCRVFRVFNTGTRCSAAIKDGCTRVALRNVGLRLVSGHAPLLLRRTPV